MNLYELVELIAKLHVDLAFVRSQELDAEMTGYLTCDEPSQEAKKRAGKYAAATFTKEVWKLEAELAAAIERKFYLIRMEANKE
jgi:hypothetical protein